MILYIAFAGGLLFFHGYLLVSNLTTRELVKRSKCHYLAGVRSNPFSDGLIHNLKTAIFVEEDGKYIHLYKDNGFFNLKIWERKDPELVIRRFGRMITTHVVEKYQNVKYLFLPYIFLLFKHTFNTNP